MTYRTGLSNLGWFKFIFCNLRQSREPGDGVLAEKDFEAEALRISEAAKNNGLVLRLLGALAIRIHCPKYCYLHEDMNRRYTDLDFAAYRKQNDKILKLLTGLGYSYDFRMVAVFGANRVILENNTTQLKVDIFYDKLEFCHTIDFTKNQRLEVDYPTISVSDLLLEKMQIVSITEKDIIDTSILLLEHDVGISDKDVINIGYLTKLLAQDWGFYYTVTTNLAKVGESILRNNKISSDERAKATTNIDKILKEIEDASKSTGWKIRARVGPSKKWYRDVEEVIR